MFSFYKDKKILITGHTGFKGTWLALWLHTLGADVTGYALEPDTEPCLFTAIGLDSKINSVFGNILDNVKLEKVFNDFQPEIVFHLAAQPLVRRSYDEPVLTYQTNVVGTLNVLEAARKCESVKAFVNVTTDKCYENKESDYAYKETDVLGGYDMYSSSKACSEILSASYRNSFLNDQQGGYNLATARAGNVIGGGDWAPDRLVPDCIKSLVRDENIELRNPVSIRPWQHVLEPLSGYLMLGEKLFGSCEYACGINFGPHPENVYKVSYVAQKIIDLWGSGVLKTVKNNDSMHEAKILTLDINKAKSLLGWEPVYTIDEAIEKTVEWYKYFYQNSNMYDLSITQIKEYERKLNGKTASKPC